MQLTGNLAAFVFLRCDNAVRETPELLFSQLTVRDVEGNADDTHNVVICISERLDTAKERSISPGQFVGCRRALQSLAVCYVGSEVQIIHLEVLCQGHPRDSVRNIR